MSTLTLDIGGELTEVEVNLLEQLGLSQSLQDALSQKFAAQPKAIKQAVRAFGTEGNEAVQYAVYLISKTAKDYLSAQMRDIWVQRLEMLIPRLNTKDEKLLTQTENAVASIALEIEDVDQRADIQTLLKKNLLPKSTDAYTLLQCFDSMARIFTTAWKS